MSRLRVVGVDGGGTKTLALAADASGRVVGRGLAGPSNLYPLGFEAASAAIQAAIAAALDGAEPAALCLGLSGAGRPQEAARFAAWAAARYPAARLQVVSDAEILLAAGASEGPALGLICGTGSIVYGRSATGDLLRAGGWGYLFGDEGSGFAIGAAALRAVAQAADGRAAATLLTGLVLARRGVDAPAGLIPDVYGAPSPRSEIAGLADLVEQAAAQGDAIAAAILEQAASDLAGAVQAVYRQLGGRPVPLALTGGVILNGRCLAAAFQRACAGLGLGFSSIRPTPEPAEGAVRLALTLIC